MRFVFLLVVLPIWAQDAPSALEREATGSDLSTKPMLAYFAPLTATLERENAGRACAWQPRAVP